MTNSIGYTPNPEATLLVQIMKKLREEKLTKTEGEDKG